MAIKVTLNSAGLEAVLKSSEMREMLEGKAAAIAAAAGEGFAHSSTIGRTRALAMAWPESAEAKAAEADGLALTRSIDAGRA